MSPSQQSEYPDEDACQGTYSTPEQIDLKQTQLLWLTMII